MAHLWQEGFVVRQPAWHGLADVLPDYPGLEEGMKLAGHNHNIIEKQLAIENIVNSSGPSSPLTTEYQPLTGWKALAREDTGAIVSVMPSTYSVIQNRVPWELLDSLFSQGAKWDTAGILKGRFDEANQEVKGQVYWCMTLLDEPIKVDGDDSPIFPYLAATWSHDGSQAVKFRAMNVRIVCANTHHAAMFGSSGRDLDISIRHIGNPEVRIAKAKEALHHCRKRHQEFLVAANELASMRISEEGLAAFVETVLPMPIAAEGLVITDRVRGNIEKARGELWNVFNGKTVAPGIRNTAYGMFEAGVEYLDHVRPHRTAETYFQRNVMRVEATKAALLATVQEIASTYPLCV